MNGNDCHACGGAIQNVSGPGRTIEYRGVKCAIPDGFVIRTCAKCGREWMSDAEVDALSPILEAQRPAQATPATKGTDR